VCVLGLFCGKQKKEKKKKPEGGWGKIWDIPST
jgi:hypothetical protein